MSEEERRRGYSGIRILIEAARVLTPSFVPQGIYLSGGQVEMLRNILHYLNRRSTFVDEYHAGYYLMPDDTDWDTIQALVADMENKAMSNDNTPWGFSESWVEDLSFTQSGSGTAETTVSVEDEDYVVVLEGVSLANQSGSRGFTRISVREGTVEMFLAAELTLVQYVPILWTGRMTLKAGDEVRIRQGAAIDGDVYKAVAWGYTMKVPD